MTDAKDKIQMNKYTILTKYFTTPKNSWGGYQAVLYKARPKTISWTGLFLPKPDTSKVFYSVWVDNEREKENEMSMFT